jgi:hypothetical protein
MPNDPRNILPDFDFAGMGGWLGAQEGLRGVVARRSAEAALQRKQTAEDFKSTLDMRKQFLDEDTQSEKVREFDLNEPTRQSEIVLRTSQAKDLDRKPEEAMKAHERIIDKAILDGDINTALEHTKALHDLQKQRENNYALDERAKAQNETTIKAAGIRAAGSGTDAAGKTLPSMRADELGEINASLELTSELRDKIGKEGETGFTSWIGRKLPNFVTEYTGLGGPAKDRQALIAVVKQIIGKGLEGGVLREHDEVKYKDILPTISDPNDLVMAKLEGLDQALSIKSKTAIDSYEDAGYEMTRYRARQAAAAAAKQERDAKKAAGAAAAEAFTGERYDPTGKTRIR